MDTADWEKRTKEGVLDLKNDIFMTIDFKV
jgi:hypothetical protein